MSISALRDFFECLSLRPFCFCTLLVLLRTCHLFGDAIEQEIFNFEFVSLSSRFLMSWFLLFNFLNFLGLCYVSRSFVCLEFGILGVDLLSSLYLLESLILLCSFWLGLARSGLFQLDFLDLLVLVCIFFLSSSF
jgi:hypothetical protein